MLQPVMSLSRSHVNLTVDDADYWSFSFDEMGKFDIPAALIYISDVANVSKISYVGHSMGTVMFWVAMNQVELNYSTS